MTRTTIEQQAGPKRRIILDGRGGFLADSVEWGSEQRMDVTHLPGSKSGIAQVFGSRELPMQPRGRWRDVHMQGDSPACFVYVMPGGQTLRTAREAAHLMDLICKEGILLRVAYETEVRYGMLREFRYRPHAEGRTLEWIDWSASFEWLSDSENPGAPTIPTRTGVSDLAGRLAIVVQQLDDAVDTASSAVALADGYVTQALGAVETVRSIKDSALQVATNFAERVASVASVAQNVVGLCSEVQDAYHQMVDLVQGVATNESLVDFSVDDLSTSSSIGKQLAVVAYRRGILSAAEVAWLLADQVQADALTGLQEVQDQVVYARRGDDLRDIAYEYLGHREDWRKIAEANSLSGSELAIAQAILLPRR